MSERALRGKVTRETAGSKEIARGQGDVAVVDAKAVPLADIADYRQRVSQTKRDDWSHYSGLLILGLIAFGAFAILYVSGAYKSEKVIDLAIHIINTMVGAVIAYVFIRK